MSPHASMRPWRHRVMALVVLGAASVGLPAPVLGGPLEPPFHVTFSVPAYDDVVCGIPVIVDESGQFTITELVDRNGQFLFRGTAYLNRTYTASDGETVVVTDANQLTSGEAIIDESAGTITLVNTLRGVLEKMKLADGSVLFVDAGYATDALTFDLETEELISFQNLVGHGPAPLRDSGFSLWCEAFVAALG